MKTAISSSLFIVMLWFTAFGQKKPDSKTLSPLVVREEYSSVYDIRHFENFSITALSPRAKKSIEAIAEVLSREPSIKSAAPSAAQFIVRYREANGKSEMKVYYSKNKVNIIVWAEDRAGRGRETELTEAFLDVLQRNKKLDEEGKPAADAE